MKVNELKNLYVGINYNEDFLVLIVADDEQTAMEKAKEYFKQAKMDLGNITVKPFAEFDMEMQFDCDYVLI